MARPYAKKKDQILVNETEVYTLIKTILLNKYGYSKSAIKSDLIKDVFKSYAEIVLSATGDNHRINLPYLGQFFSSEEKGFGGGFITYRKNFLDKNTEVREYFPPKPNHRIIRFEIRKKVKDTFKKATEIPLNFTKKELEELKKQAELKEKKKIEDNG